MTYQQRSCIVLQRDLRNKDLACPKPCRASANGFRGRSHGLLQADVEAGHEILEILFGNTCLGDNSSNTINPQMLDSPPTRTSNPLIHDVQFDIQKKKFMPSALLKPKNFAHNSGNDSSYKQSCCGPSYGSKQPFVRIEGFFSSTGEAHRDVINFA